METIPVEMRRMIMGYLSNVQLLKVSLVNKQFNFEARSLMRERASSVAVLKSFDPCRGIVSLMSDLKQMNVVPFAGIHIQLHSLCGIDDNHRVIHRQVCQKSPPTPEWDPTYDEILDRLPWKRLSVKFLDCHLIKNSSTLQLAQTILKRYCTALEELSLSDNSRFLLWIQQLIPDCRFPRLKILKLNGEYTNQTPINFIKQIVSRAPNLEELHQRERTDFVENVLEGSSAVFVHPQALNLVLHEISEGVAGTIRLRHLGLHNDGREGETPVPFTVERFNRIIPLVLQSSSATLKSLRIDLVFAIPFMCYGITLKNVTSLEVCLDYSYLNRVQPGIFTILKQFDFTRIFPALCRVNIRTNSRNLPPDYIRECFDRGNAMLKDSEPDRAINIKHISFGDCLNVENVPFFAKMFPNIEKLSTYTYFGKRVPYEQIWKHWPDLKKLVANKIGSLQDRTRNENLDSDFCGIFPEEVALLREKDDEYLEAVNIVPVMPSVTCVPALRTVILYHSETHPLRTKITNMADQTQHVFSKVTALIAFRRSSNLSVTIYTDSPQVLEALDYMRPYTSVVLTK